ncbi:MAG: Nucleoside-diphosphate sugar epimerase [Polaromonas sp.]|jgi:UDP-glucose 4-epimerase|nr:Nucleoside-diphosphate sugar epimerase [Polaromonas sp.]MDB5938552.1 Nucleoside-diphosphate sugar epimerase [Polaromonas sp.]
MKVMITGGTGFLAAWLIRRLLAGGHSVRVLDRNQNYQVARAIAGPGADSVEWRIGDVTRRTDVDDALQGCDVAVSLAGLLTPACQADPVLGAQVNLIGVLNVFEAAKAAGHRKVVYASSAGVYGPDDGKTPRPTTHYGAYKLACEGCARAYWATDGIASVGLRPFVVYGPGREGGLSAGPTLATRAAAAGQPYTIGYTGLSDLLYVDDAAAAFEAAIVQPVEGAHVFNLLGEVADVNAVIAEIRRHAPDAELHADGPHLPIAPHLGHDNLAQVLRGLPRTRLADGIAATFAYYAASQKATA